MDFTFAEAATPDLATKRQVEAKPKVLCNSQIGDRERTQQIVIGIDCDRPAALKIPLKSGSDLRVWTSSLSRAKTPFALFFRTWSRPTDEAIRNYHDKVQEFMNGELGENEIVFNKYLDQCLRSEKGFQKLEPELKVSFSLIASDFRRYVIVVASFRLFLKN